MSVFVEKIDLSLASKLRGDLIEQGFELQAPQYTLFQAKKKGVSVTLYESGKLVVQGKEMKEFIEFYLEPEILKSFSFTYGNLDLDLTPRIGIDESGKGDFFGPLAIGGVFANGEQIEKLQKMGVMDSKKLQDDKAHSLAKEIRKIVPWHVVRMNPKRYNELYAQFGNLNKLLAWGHAATIEKLVEQTGCKKVIVDQFAAEWQVESALKRKGLVLDLTQRTKAESDVVVAAASILARAAFLEGLDKLSKEFGVDLPKGASKKVIEQGLAFVRTHTAERLPEVAKMHFKTAIEVTGG